ncbi:three-helix bundle dimerization domain-containing protein [Arthrobacter sp. MW3 TE3886]|uniref:three-helix bundle dimerization domain-containing protein n=1 Tax=Arthrobacter sp. MW3 TE3886 TaxID=3156254 RepID=UPI003518716E
MTDDAKEPSIDQVVERLAARFPHVPRIHIAGIVGEEFDALNAGRIRTYIPTLVERGARVRLKSEFGLSAAED